MSATHPATPTTFPCERCGQLFTLGTLVCPNCGALVYRRQLELLSADAMRLEAADPLSAALAWRKCLDLLPAPSQEYQAIAQRIGVLSAGRAPQQPTGQAGAAAYDQPAVYAPARARQVKPPDALPVAVAKTLGSMLLSILFYTILWNGSPAGRVIFAVGFAGLILIHELGHVIAMKRYGLSASPPIFIPFLGAVINMRQAPRNAWEEAVVGIGGPALGAVAAVIVTALYYQGLGYERGTEYRELLRTLAYFGLMINLFNLLPFPPLDGGRISAALSPWMWLIGIVGLGVLLYVGQIPLYLAGLLVFMGFPRIVNTLRDRQARASAYYRIPRAKSLLMAVCYALLAAVLTGLMIWVKKPAMFG